MVQHRWIEQIFERTADAIMIMPHHFRLKRPEARQCQPAQGAWVGLEQGITGKAGQRHIRHLDREAARTGKPHFGWHRQLVTRCASIFFGGDGIIHRWQVIDRG